MGLKAALSIRNIFDEFELLSSKVIKMLVDNKAAKLIAEQSVGRNSRHYQLQLLFVLDYIERKEVELKYVQSQDNWPDLYTKLVSNATFYVIREAIGVFNTKKFYETRSSNN